MVDALVAAANDAGGKDNITVVYAEAPGFAPAVRGLLGARSALKEDSQTSQGLRVSWDIKGASPWLVRLVGSNGPGQGGTRIDRYESGG